MKYSTLILAVLATQQLIAKTSFRQKPVFSPVEIKSLDTCFSPIERCDVKLISFIGTAMKQLDIAIFSITHSGIVNAIIKAKNDKNVAIRMIVDSEQSTAVSSKVDVLKSAGIEVRYGLAKSMMHDKFTIVDLKQVETGSYNYTMNATNNNLENQIYLSDDQIVKKYSTEFERMWAEATTTQETQTAGRPTE